MVSLLLGTYLRAQVVHIDKRSVCSSLSTSMGSGDSQWNVLRCIASAVGSLSVLSLTGVEQGSMMSFSLTVSALLDAKASIAAFSAVSQCFSYLPSAPGSALSVILSSLISICALANDYQEDEALRVEACLLSLLSPSEPSS